MIDLVLHCVVSSMFNMSLNTLVVIHDILYTSLSYHQLFHVHVLAVFIFSSTDPTVRVKCTQGTQGSG